MSLIPVSELRGLAMAGAKPRSASTSMLRRGWASKPRLVTPRLADTGAPRMTELIRGGDAAKLKTHVPTTSNQRVSSPWRTHGDSSALTSVRPWSGRLPAAPDPLSLLEVSFLTRILATEAMACIEVATASMLPSIRQRSPPKRRLRLTIINSRWSMMAGSAGAQQVP